MGEKRLTWTVGFGDETRTELQQLHPGWGDRDLAAEMRRIGEQEVHERWMRDRYPPTPPPPAPLEREDELPPGAAIAGPASLGGYDLAKLDRLPDPGTRITLRYPETCHNCGKTVEPGPEGEMIMRTAVGPDGRGHRQYLHLPGICD